ncbi:MAG: protoheme IX farnesyltransferase [Planctomycetes bacterium]|nr:protoheme IX farnesyltransferase [Planctomycetota bacterium]
MKPVALLEGAALQRPPEVAAARPVPAAVLTAVQDILELTKARVALLVALTTLAGFVLGSRFTGQAPEAWRILHTLLGTVLVAGAASALNQVLERDRDARMLRTAGRPLPSGRMAVRTALLAGLGLAAAGTWLLAARASVPAACLAALTFLLYVLAYTPLKARTHLATLVGAVPGALPPLIGWIAAGGTFHGPAWTLFGILFFWQIPHFLAIAWLHREDYARGGFPLLTVLDPGGGAAARQAFLNTLALLAVSLLPAWNGQAGRLYAASAVVLGAAFLAAVAWLAAARSERSARATVTASLAYLPLLLAAMVVDAGG